MRILLVPFSWLYGLIVAIRNMCYDHGIFRIVRVSVPVISVGNMTAGGTGKTPFVGYLVRNLTASGRRVAVISRGYKRTTTGTVVVSDGKSLLSDPPGAGDEAVQTALKFPSAVVIVDERRSRAAEFAVGTYHVDTIVLDDAFQHRSLGRDLDIVMIDAEKRIGEIPLLPSGTRREPMSALRRGELLMIPAGSPAGTEEDLARYSEAQSIRTRYVPARLVSLADGATFSLNAMKGKRCIGVCGIANPLRFTKTLREAGFDVEEFVVFPDHHPYSAADIAAVERKNPESSPRIVVTTEKDAVKFKGMNFVKDTPGREWFALEMEFEIVSGEEILQEQLKKVLSKG